MTPHLTTAIAPGRLRRSGATGRGGRPSSRRPAPRQLLPLLALSMLLFTVESRLHELVPGLAVIKPSMLALLFGTAVLLVRGEPVRAWRERAVDRPVLLTVAVYAGLALLGLPFSIWLGGSLKAMIALLPALCLMLVATITVVRSGLKPVLVVLVFAFGLLAMAQVIKGHDVEFGRYTVGDSLDPNDLGTLLGAMIPVAFALALQRGSMPVRLLMVACALVALIALARTGSRGGFVTLAIAMLATISQRRGPMKLVLLGVAVVSMGGLVAFGPPAFRNRVTAMLSGEKDYNFTDQGGRIQVWQRGLGHMVRNPVLGVGIGNFSTAEGELLKAEGMRGAWMAPHNSYLQAGVELGVPGLITFLVLVSHLLRRAWRAAQRRGARPMDLALFGAICGYLAGSFFLSNAFAATIFLWAGLVAARPADRIEAKAPSARPSRMARLSR